MPGGRGTSIRRPSTGSSCSSAPAVNTDTQATAYRATEPDMVAMPSRARIAAMTSRIEGTTRSPVARATTAPYPSVATSPTVPSPMYSGGRIVGPTASRTSVVTATSPSPRPASAAANARPSSATSRPSPGRMASARASRFTWGRRVTVVRGGARASTSSDGPGAGGPPRHDDGMRRTVGHSPARQPTITPQGDPRRRDAPARQDYRSTAPVTQVTVPPPTQIARPRPGRWTRVRLGRAPCPGWPRTATSRARSAAATRRAMR